MMILKRFWKDSFGNIYTRSSRNTKVNTYLLNDFNLNKIDTQNLLNGKIFFLQFNQNKLLSYKIGEKSIQLPKQ